MANWNGCGRSGHVLNWGTVLRMPRITEKSHEKTVRIASFWTKI